jgi:hypothetical protein
VLGGKLDQLTIQRESPAPSEGRSGAEAAWLAVLPCALAVLGAIILLATPLSGLLYPSAPPIVLLPEDPETLRPEPLEGTRYLMALALPLLLALATVALARLPRRRLDDRARSIAVVIAQVVALAFVAVCFAAQHEARWVIPYFSLATLAFAALFAAAVVLVLPRVQPRLRELRLGRSRAWAVGLGAAALAATVLWILPGVDSEESITWAVMHHDLAFHVDETFAVLNGLTPLADFNAQYASLFPYVIAISLLAFGKTVLVFTIVVCALSVLALVAIYGVLRRAARSSLVALALFVPLLATTLFNPEGAWYARFTPGTYFPMFPFRYGGPYLLAWLLARHLERLGHSRAWPLFVASGLVILNNFEFGMAAFGATLAALLTTSVVYRRAQLLRLAGAVAAGLAVALAAVSVLTLLRAGSLPDLVTMSRFSRLYAVAGYSVAPLPGILGLPLVIFLTYVAAVGTAVARRIDGAPNRVLTGMLAWTGVFGLGTASYYVARSNGSLMPMMFSAWALALALLTLVVLEALRAGRVRQPGLPALAALFGLGLAICSIFQFPYPWTEISRLQTPPPQVTPAPTTWAQPPTREPQVRRFLASTPEPGGRFVVRRGAPIALFVTTGHRIADAYGVVDVVPFTGPESMHTLSEFERALDALRDAGGDTVLLQWQRVVNLHRALERRGFRLLTHAGVRSAPLEARGALPPDATVVEELTKWVDVRAARS